MFELSTEKPKGVCPGVLGFQTGLALCCLAPWWSLLVMLTQVSSTDPFHILLKIKYLFLVIEATHPRTISIFHKLKEWQYSLFFF